MSLNPLDLWHRLTSTYWFLPAVITISCGALGVGLTVVDRISAKDASWLGWVYGGGADGARALLSAVAGSIITVVSVTFSVMVVALTVSSQHFGPRLLNSFMRDTPSQTVLGMFTGTFAYCLVVLRTVQADVNGNNLFVPHLAVTGSVVLSLLSVAMLIFYVHHIATSMQVSQITARVVRDFEDSIDRLYPDPIGEGIEDITPLPEPPEECRVIPAPASGYVQEIDAKKLLKVAVTCNSVIWIVARPGDFVSEGTPIARLYPPVHRAHLERDLGKAFRLGTDRTARQDVGFAAQQLVEVALRALSPGVNEPFTAITCVDRLGQALSRLALRRIPSALRRGPDGALRVVAAPRQLRELLLEIFEPLITNAASRTPGVLMRLMQTLGSIAAVARRPAEREAIRELAEQVRDASADTTPHAAARIAAMYEDVQRLVGERTLTPPRPVGGS